MKMIILKVIFVLEYQTRRTTFCATSLFLFMFTKFYLVKMCPNFVGSQVSCLAGYQKILLECLFGFKKSIEFFLPHYEILQMSPP